MEVFSLAVEWITGCIDFIAVFGFLLLSYKFSDLAKHYDILAFKEIGRGFHFLFFSYLVPFVGLFLGYVVAEDAFVDWAFICLSVPATTCTIIAFLYFFRSIKSIIAYANASKNSI